MSYPQSCLFQISTKAPGICARLAHGVPASLQQSAYGHQYNYIHVGASQGSLHPCLITSHAVLLFWYKTSKFQAAACFTRHLNFDKLIRYQFDKKILIIMPNFHKALFTFSPKAHMQIIIIIIIIIHYYPPSKEVLGSLKFYFS